MVGESLRERVGERVKGYLHHSTCKSVRKYVTVYMRACE